MRSRWERRERASTRESTIERAEEDQAGIECGYASTYSAREVGSGTGR